MSKPGRSWLVVEDPTTLRLRSADGNNLGECDDAFVVIDEERVAFRVAQATLRLREENQRLALENAELRSRSI